MDPQADLRLMLEVIQAELSLVPLHEAAHGFVPGRSCKTNAIVHRQKQVVCNLDIKDFFNSVRYDRMLVILQALGVPSWVLYWLPVCFYDNGLATGASTSPVLSNIYMKQLDEVFSAYAEKRNLSYTRYADDMTFSGDILDKGKDLIAFVRGALSPYGLKLNLKKIKLMPYYQKQVVTGILVNNEKLSLPRKYKEWIFLEVRGKTFESLSLELAGSLEYVRSVDPAFYMKLLKEIEKNG